MYPLVHHKNLSIEKWSRYTKGQQILMIGNELNRAKNLLEKNMMPEVKNCYERAMELTDLISGDQKWRGRLKELRRFREVLSELYLDDAGNPALNYKLYKTLIEMIPEAYNMLH
ncbi:MAG: hypothetical protein P8X42_06250 [Calditrichaceae bacterium]|jgi:hypothetical protein